MNAGPGGKGRDVDVGEVIDSAKFFPIPFLISLMMIVIMLTDGFDLGTMGRVAGAIAADWADQGVQLQDVLGPVNMAGLIGMAIGSVALGWLGDRIGRKRAYVACLFFLFLGSILCYFAQNVSQLTIFRAITGLGLGGVTPLAATLISEWTNKRVRSVAVAAVIVAVPLGAAIAGPVERIIVPEFGWRSMFFVGAMAPLVLFVLFSYLLPESPKYMAQHPEQHKKLARALNRLIGEKRFDGTENFFVSEEGQRSSNWFSTIWNQHYRRATALIWIAFAVNSFVLFAFTNNLQPLLIAAEQSPALASQAADMFFYGAFFGSIGGAFLIRSLGSRFVGVGLALLGVSATAMIAIVLSPTMAGGLLLTLALLAGMSVNGMQAFLYAVTAHSYPTEIRGSAVGMAQTFSRIGAVLSAPAAAFYLMMDPRPPVSAFLFFVAACAVVTTISFFLIPSHIPPATRKKPADVLAEGREAQEPPKSLN